MLIQLHDILTLSELSYFRRHFILVEYAVLVFVLIMGLLAIIFIVSTRTLSSFEKRTSYECGFAPFGDARMQMNIHFYLVGILYLIFDLELIFFYPWVYSFSVFLNRDGFFAILIFITLLGIGFVYEWQQGVFQWTKVK